MPTFVPISDEPEFDEQNPYTPSNSFPHYAMYPTIDVSGIEYLTSHSANAASSRLQSTPVGPNDVLLCPPNPVREWNCCEDLLSRLEKQETENAELKRQQFDLMQRIEALENSAHNAAMYMPRAAAVDCDLQEKFENKDLLRIKGSLFVVGRAITSDMCKELVLNLYENEPTLDYTVETIRTINEYKRCTDAPTLSKCAVLELFSLGNLAGRNCFRRSATGERKLPLDKFRLKFIEQGVFEIYPQRSEFAR